MPSHEIVRAEKVQRFVVGQGHERSILRKQAVLWKLVALSATQGPR